MKREYYVYILTNKSNNVLYVGVTNNLKRRITEHKIKNKRGFTSRYNVNKLVYYEKSIYINNTIKREKQIKNLLRRKKNNLISSFNERWDDLYHTL